MYSLKLTFLVILAIQLKVITALNEYMKVNSSKVDNKGLNEYMKVNNTKIYNKVLLISIDGFRWDFKDKTKTKYLDYITKNGATAGYVQNVFPTSTLPNHQSIVTGRYPENHGLVDNAFMEPASGRIFNGLSGDFDLEWWGQAEPIWTLDEKHGHKSGVLFWPGYRTKYNNMTPSFLPSAAYVSPFEPEGNGKVMDVSDRIDLAIDWLKKDDVNLVVMYTEEPDDTAHNYSPDSNKTENVKEIKAAVKSVDDLVKNLTERLEKANLTSKVNTIMLGDHGQVNTTYLKNVYLDDFINTTSDVRYIGAFTNVFIYTKPDKTQYVYDKLKNADPLKKHFQVYLKKDIPDRFHIKNNSRTGEILLLPEPGWTITCELNNVPYLKGKWERGDHGYSNFERTMNPAFFSFGPDFRKGYRKKCVHTVDIYSLIAHILNLKGEENDGKFERIKSLLLDDAPRNEIETAEEVKEEEGPPACERMKWV